MEFYLSLVYDLKYHFKYSMERNDALVKSTSMAARGLRKRWDKVEDSQVQIQHSYEDHIKATHGIMNDSLYNRMH